MILVIRPEWLRTDSGSFSTHPSLAEIDPRERGKGYAKRCEDLLDLNDVSVTTIQACVLLGAIGVVDGKPASETIYYAIACRIAQLLDLPNCQAANQVEQELYIRGMYHTRFTQPRLTSKSVVDTLHDRCLVFNRSPTPTATVAKTKHTPPN